MCLSVCACPPPLHLPTCSRAASSQVFGISNFLLFLLRLDDVKHHLPLKPRDRNVLENPFVRRFATFVSYTRVNILELLESRRTVTESNEIRFPVTFKIMTKLPRQ